ncbi:hypothetical protein DC487_01135 [Sphingobacterium corticibacter]|uniref:Uncharacterized protein n=1 Tax=Sphingobacterium corticibacter TaxID=2171749 RepID=A0A2T8HLD1_9SPHI|nr:hypothetical protein DC487_01135 [Sphingobacterium corticibacter]
MSDFINAKNTISIAMDLASKVEKLATDNLLSDSADKITLLVNVRQLSYLIKQLDHGEKKLTP